MIRKYPLDPYSRSALLQALRINPKLPLDLLKEMKSKMIAQ
jgi:hypothetical protein